MGSAVDNRSLFNDEEFSDITITLEAYDEEEEMIHTGSVSCHRAILCHASKYFKSMCSPANKADDNQKVSIAHEDDGELGATNEAVLRHIYNFTYAEIKELCNIDDAEQHVANYLAARKYLLPKLEQEAFSALHTKIRATSNRCKSLASAKRLHDLVELLLRNKNHNVEFEKTAECLIRKHLPQLFKVRNFRKSLERKDRADVLKLVNGAMERGYQFHE